MSGEDVIANVESDEPFKSFENDLRCLRIPSRLYREMIDHLRAELPFEGCGLIAFHNGQAVKVFRGTNTEASGTRYNMDLTEVVDFLAEIDGNEWRLGALFHSHPKSQPTPSETDLNNATYPEQLMVIVSFAAEPPDARAFRVDGDVQQVPIEII